jgi:hypothetical protein
MREAFKPFAANDESLVTGICCAWFWYHVLYDVFYTQGAGWKHYEVNEGTMMHG